jgi:diaminopimelate decarboxylase
MDTAEYKLKNGAKPTLFPHRGEGMHTLGAVGEPLHQTELDGVEIEPLLDQYGSPLFILSEQTLRDNARRLHRAFATRWPKVRHGWSYKTNYLNAVCSILHQEGSWAEVVSEFEYQKARALGVPGSRIIFNGPWKPSAILELAVREGAQIHIDHLDEIHCLEQIAQGMNNKVAVGIRLNFDTGLTDTWGRFGFNLESGAAMDAAQCIASSKWLRLSGLHSHIGTFILDTRAYSAQARIMAEFMEKVEHDTACQIEYLDMGGGFASCNALLGALQPQDLCVPSFDEYAEAITGSLLQATRLRSATGKPLPTLILETGRALVDDAEILVTRIVGGKSLPDGRRVAILDAGVNLLFTAFGFKHEVKPLRPHYGTPEETVLVGPLCMNTDVLRHSVMLPPLNVGDALTVSPAGAYNNTLWMQFIQYRPAVVMVTQEGKVEVVRVAEQLAAINQSERLPKALRLPFPRGLPE